MQPLDIYATIEQYLDFDTEVQTLYNAIASVVLENKPKNLIDIGCGQGDFCKILQGNGIDCFGVDLSSKQIQIAQQKGINAKCIDIKDIDETFYFATAVFDVINYICNDDLKDFLTNVYNLLEDGGKFVFDINSYFGFDEVAQGTLSIDVDQKFIVLDAIFENNCLDTNITLFSKQNQCYIKEQGTITQYYYSSEKLKKILKNIGFSVKNYGFNLHNYEKDDKIIFICTKGDKR